MTIFDNRQDGEDIAPRIQASSRPKVTTNSRPRQQTRLREEISRGSREKDELINGIKDESTATTFIFKDPDALPAIPIPEMATLTTDVPAKEQISILLGPVAILTCDLIIPCAIYYSWLHKQPHQPSSTSLASFDKDILGLAVIPFGFGELYILLVRVYRLIRYREQCAPLLSQHWWDLDATSWVYAAALLAGLIPFVAGSSLQIPQLYLYAPGIYMSFLLCWALLSLLPFRTPVRINSEPSGERMRPLLFYAAEDFLAVDGWQGRGFRRKYRERYAVSPLFRRMFVELTVWWCGGSVVYLGALSGVIWETPFRVAFGLSLGLLFSFIIVWAVCTFIYVQIALERERKWWKRKKTQSTEV